MLWSHSKDLPLLVVLDFFFFFFGHEACRIFSSQVMAQVPPALGAQTLNHWTLGKSMVVFDTAVIITVVILLLSMG